MPVPSISFVGSNQDLIANGWEYSFDNVQFASLNPEAIPHSYNGCYVRYMAQNACGFGYSDTVQITVDSLPTLTAVSSPAPICSGDSLSLSTMAPSVTYHSERSRSEGWMDITAGGTQELVPGTTFDYGTNTSIYYYAANACGTTNSDTVPVTVIRKPSVDALSGLTDAVCEGTVLPLAEPSYEAYGSVATTEWRKSAELNGTYAAFDVTAPVSYDMNLDYVRFFVTNVCGVDSSNAVQLMINATPVVAPADTNVTLCSASTLNPTAPSVADRGSEITQRGWLVLDGTDTIAGIIFPQTVDYDTWNGRRLVYFATNTCGTSYSNEMTVTVHPEHHLVVSAEWPEICIGRSYTVKAHSDLATATYAWSSDPESGLPTENDSVMTCSGASLGVHTYTVTATDAETGCTETGSVDVSVQFYGSNDTVIACEDEMPYTYGNDSIHVVCDTAGDYSLSFPLPSGCDSIVNIHLIVPETRHEHTRAGLCEEGAGYYWPVTDSTYTHACTDTVRVPYATLPCDSVVYTLLVTNGDLFLELADRRLEGPADSPLTTTFRMSSDCPNNHDKVAVTYTLYKDGAPVPTVGGHGTLNFRTDFPTLQTGFGSDVSAGTGEIPGSTVNIYNYDYDYFYMDFARTTSTSVTATWSEPGEYRLVLDLYTRDAGTDFPLSYSLNRHIGGSGSHNRMLFASDTLVMVVGAPVPPTEDTVPVAAYDGLIDIDTTFFAQEAGVTSSFTVAILGDTLNPTTKLSLDYEITRDGEPVAVTAQYGNARFETEYNRLNRYFGSDLVSGTGSIPANTFSVIYYNYDYFYNHFMETAEHRLSTTWNVPGEYKVKFYLREREGGQDYPLTYNLGTEQAVLGGHGSTAVGRVLDIDSVVFRIVADTVRLTHAASVCSNDLPYEYLGREYYRSGTYEFSDAAGVYDTVVTLNLTVNLEAETSDAVTVCTGELPYTYGDTVFGEGTVSGNYDLHFRTVAGCDSLVHLALTVHPSAVSFDTTAACESHVWNGLTLTETGDYEAVLVAANGCDSTAHLHLTIHRGTHEAYTETACDSYGWHDTTYTQSGTYTYVYENEHGCSSTDTLHLTIHRGTHEAYAETACGSYEWHGQLCTESGTYTHDYVNEYGCSCTDTLHLTVNHGTHEAYTETACGSYEWHDTTYTQSGTYTYVYENEYGCSSTDTLHLTVNHGTHEAYAETACGSYEWHGQLYTESGTYTHDYENEYGCSSTDTLHLTVNPTYAVEDFREITSAELPHEWNGVTFTASGTRTAVLASAAGCDSTVTMTLTVTDVTGGEPFATVAYSGDSAVVRIFANEADPATKVSANYSLYKGNGLVQNVEEECGGALYIGTLLQGSLYGEHLLSATGNVPENTFHPANRPFDYLYFHFIDGRENVVTHGFTEPGDYTVVFEVTEETGGQDYTMLYDADLTHRIGGKNSTEGGVLCTAVVTFHVEAPDVPTVTGPELVLSSNDITEAVSTDTLTVEANGHDLNTKAAIFYTVLRDGEPLSMLSGEVTLTMETWFSGLNGYVGKQLTNGAGSIPDNTFRPVSSYLYNYLYLNYMGNTHNRIRATWHSAGDYAIAFSLVEMAGGSDLGLTWSAGNRLGGRSAHATGVVLATDTLRYSIAAPSQAAPTAIGEAADEETQQDVTLRPNPARERTVLTLGGEPKNAEVVVTDVNGREVHRSTAADVRIELDVRGWSEGVYFVTVREAAGTSVTRKLVVTK